jgi:Predicted nucleoside-diphosphate-sugar epimerases
MLLGATGLVGQECLRLLIEDDSVSRVVVLARRPLLPSLSALKVEEHVIDFADLASCGAFFDVDQVICALGTTLKKTPSRDEYRAIDFNYPVTAARLALEHGTRHFLIVSAVGANSKSPLFYNRLKGEVEGCAEVDAIPLGDDCAAVGVDWRASRASLIGEDCVESRFSDASRIQAGACF